MLADEYGTASNIKSRVNRLSVLGAITSVQHRLKLYTKVPPNGLVSLCEICKGSEMEEGNFPLTKFWRLFNCPPGVDQLSPRPNLQWYNCSVGQKYS